MLIRDTGKERLYWFQDEDRFVGGVRYIHVRTYTLKDRWTRTGDQWFKVEEELPWWEIDFDYRPEKES